MKVWAHKSRNLEDYGKFLPQSSPTSDQSENKPDSLFLKSLISPNLNLSLLSKFVLKYLEFLQKI